MRFLHKLIHWYFGKDALPYWCVLALDCAILITCYFFAYYCLLGPGGITEYFWKKLWTLMACLVPYLVCFKLFHTYANIIRYSSFIDLLHVAFANLLASTAVFLVRITCFEMSNVVFPGMRETLYAFVFSTLAMCGWRVLIKYLFDITSVNAGAKRIFIFGDKSGAVSLAKSIRTTKPVKYVVKGFVTTDNTQETHYISNIPVYVDDESLVPTMQRGSIRTLMVSPLQTEVFRQNERLINELVDADIRIYMMPEAREWDGKEDVTRDMLHHVEIEDLLPREKIEVDLEAIGKLLKGKSILVTGAAGSIGSEMVRQIATFSPENMILIDQAETPMHDIRRLMANNYPDIHAATIVTSITKEDRMEKIFRDYRPEFVFHAAAYKHVPMMEDNPSEAIQNNVYGTRVIADLSVKYGTKKFVMISTDKAVNPTNVMGCSKRICEIYCQSLNQSIVDGSCPIKSLDSNDKQTKPVTQFVTTRFGNVLGSNGSVIPIFREQIKNGGPVTVTHPEIVRYFMLIPEACKLVLEAGTFGKGGEIFVFDMGNPVKIADLAKKMIAISGAKDVKIEFTGLRDGEKLYEEVLDKAEVTRPTKHPKIRVAHVREYPYDVACDNEERLMQASLTYDDMAVVKVMKEIVPEFKSNHSKYEKLDINK